MTAQMRTRTDNQYNENLTQFMKTVFTTGGPTDVTDYRTYYTKETESVYHASKTTETVDRYMLDWIVSNYVNRKKQGEIIASPCTKTKASLGGTAASVTQCSSYLRLAETRTVNPPDMPMVRTGTHYCGTRPATLYLGEPFAVNTFSLIPDDCNIEQMEQLAVTRAHARIDTSDAAAIVTAGELKESIDFLVDSGLRLIKIYKAVRTFNLKALAKQLSPTELTSRYLEFRYAIRPLISEIDTYAQAFINTSKSKRYTYRAKEEYSSIKIGPEYLTYQDGYGYVYAREELIRTVTVLAGVLCSLDVSKLDKWGFTKPIDAAYDLLPLSFIADWFFNIGQTIASFTPEAGIKQLTSWRSTTDKIRRVKRVTRVSMKPDTYASKPGRIWNFNISNAEIYKETENYERVIDPQLSILPTFKLRLDGWKMLDIALILKSITVTPLSQKFVKKRGFRQLDFSRAALFN